MPSTSITRDPADPQANLALFVALPDINTLDTLKCICCHHAAYSMLPRKRLSTQAALTDHQQSVRPLTVNATASTARCAEQPAHV